jgi:hypothetical protein
MDHVVKMRSGGTVVSISGSQRNALTPAGCHGPILFLQIQCHSLERVARARFVSEMSQRDLYPLGFASEKEFEPAFRFGSLLIEKRNDSSRI